MKVILKAGSTSNILQIFIADSSSTTGAGLTGLVFNTASLTAYYHKDADTTATAITLVTMTVGTYTSSGFKEIDATNMPGWYQFCPPNAAVSSGANVGFHLKGATNMAPLPIEVQLVAVDLQDTVRLGLTSLPNAAAEAAGGLYTRGSGAGQIGQPANGRINVQVAGVTAGAIAANSFQAGAIDATAIAADAITAAKVASDVGTEIASAVWDMDATGHQTQGTFGQAIGDPGADTDTIWSLANTNLDATISSRMATYTQPTGFLAATFPATVASTTNITAGVITTATNLTNAPTNGDFTATMKTSLNAATPASVTGAVGSVTGNVGGNVTGSVGSVVGAVGSVTGAVGSVTGDIGGLAAGAITDVADAVWDAPIASHLDAGSTGEALSNAGSSGDPWGTALPGAYSAGTAGYIVGTNLDATVSSRLATVGYTAPNNSGITAIKAKTDSLTFTVAGQVDANAESMNAATINGTGTSGDLWRGA